MFQLQAPYSSLMIHAHFIKSGKIQTFGFFTA